MEKIKITITKKSNKQRVTHKVTATDNEIATLNFVLSVKPSIIFDAAMDFVDNGIKEGLK